MNQRFLNRTTSIGTIVLGLLAAATVGCGSDSNGKVRGADGAGDNSDAVAVTQQSLVVNGCGINGWFGITAPQFINDVAVDQSMLSNANFQLYTVNNQGVQSLVNQTAQAASAAFQSMINAQTNNVNAAQAFSQQYAQTANQQTAAANQLSNQFAAQQAARNGSVVTQTNTAVTHADLHDQASQAYTQNFGNAAQTAAQQSFGSAANQNVANANSVAAQNAYGNNNAFGANNNVAAQNSFANSIGPTLFYGGFASPSIFTNQGTVANNANAFNTGNFFNTGNVAQQASNLNNANFASNNQANAAQSAQNWNNGTSLVASNHAANQTADTAATVTSQAFNDNVLSTTQALVQSSTVSNLAQLASTAAQASNAASNQAAAASYQNAANTSQQFSNTMAFNNLSNLQSNNMLLHVVATANQANSLMRIFTGTGGWISPAFGFPLATPACGAKVGDGAVADPPAAAPAVTTTAVPAARAAALSPALPAAVNKVEKEEGE